MGTQENGCHDVMKNVTQSSNNISHDTIATDIGNKFNNNIEMCRKLNNNTHSSLARFIPKNEGSLSCVYRLLYFLALAECLFYQNKHLSLKG